MKKLLPLPLKTDEVYDDGEHEPEIAGCGLASNQDASALLVQTNLERVDAMIVLYDGKAGLDIIVNKRL